MGQLLGVSPAPAVAPGAGRARWLLWLALGLLLFTAIVGRAWDGAWHATHIFETFFSPPHLFIYGMTAVTGLLVATLIAWPDLRRWFGPTLRVPLVPYPVPGALAILGGGFGTLALAGMLDAVWHTSFGLDETLWSTPHAMLGWGLLLAALGFIACRLAQGPRRPLRWYTAVGLGVLMLAFSAMPFLGPLNANNTTEHVRAVASIPALAAQQAPQHTFRIYLAWNLTRENPLLIPLGAFWAAAALALVRRLDRRWWVFLLAALLWSATSLLGERGDARPLDEFLQRMGQTPFGLVGDRADWLPLPVLPAALAFFGLSLARLRERWAWGAAGLIFGLLTYLIWRAPHGAPLVLLAAPAAMLGAMLGARVYQVLERPSRAGVSCPVLTAAPAVPLLVGMVDLWLRFHTP